MWQLWLLIGRLGFWMAWPLLWVYFHAGKRTRVVIVAEGKVLVVKGWLSPGYWNLPGGGLHLKEDPATGAVREIYEETGLQFKPDQLKMLYQATSNAYKLHFKYICFTAELPKIVDVKRQPGEIVEIAWLDPKTITPNNSAADAYQVVQTWFNR